MKEPKDEAEFKANMMSVFRQYPPEKLVPLRHEDKLTSGIPDISVTGVGRTLWIEAKIRTTRGIHRTGIQEATVARLARNGRAIYAVYDKVSKETYCIHGAHEPSATSPRMACWPGYQPTAAAIFAIGELKCRSVRTETSTVDSTPPLV